MFHTRKSTSVELETFLQTSTKSLAASQKAIKSFKLRFPPTLAPVTSAFARDDEACCVRSQAPAANSAQQNTRASHTLQSRLQPTRCCRIYVIKGNTVFLHQSCDVVTWMVYRGQFWEKICGSL